MSHTQAAKSAGVDYLGARLWALKLPIPFMGECTLRSSFNLCFSPIIRICSEKFSQICVRRPQCWNSTKFNLPKQFTLSLQSSNSIIFVVSRPDFSWRSASRATPGKIPMNFWRNTSYDWHNWQLEIYMFSAHLVDKEHSCLKMRQ